MRKETDYVDIIFCAAAGVLIYLMISTLLTYYIRPHKEITNMNMHKPPYTSKIINTKTDPTATRKPITYQTKNTQRL